MTQTLTVPQRPARRGNSRRRGVSGNGLGLGLATLWLSLIVLLPLAAIVVTSVEGGSARFVDEVTDPAALATLRVTVGLSLIVSLINGVMGTLIAYVLVRDDFPGKTIFSALIDLPFALPTIVASLVLLSLYGPKSPVGLTLNGTRGAVVLALLFVTLPFVVRQVQPVLAELPQDMEEAAASLGASNGVIFRRIVLPALLPALLSGMGLAFARALGEYGSVVLVGGDIPGDTQVASQYIQQQVEVNNDVGAAAVSVVLLATALLTLAAVRLVVRRVRYDA